MEWIGVVVGILAGVSGIILGWSAKTRSIKEEGVEEGVLKTDLKYIRKGIDEIKGEMKGQDQKLDELSVCVAGVKERVDLAHKRIDRLEKGEVPNHG